MQVNYNEISKTYDNMRSEDKSIIDSFIQEMQINSETRVLDFGCGTGNYANALQQLTHAQVHGIDPSDGMIGKAKLKNPCINFKKGSHENIPFEDSYFDFVYMTDVIHHVPDIGIMFSEIGRVLKYDGKLCIVTQSHVQIDNRFYVSYFPTTTAVDKKRYPDIDEIINKAQNKPFLHIKNDVIGQDAEVSVNSDFVELVRNKGYSMFHLIPDDEHTSGLKKLEEDVLNGITKHKHSGMTLVWFQKK